MPHAHAASITPPSPPHTTLDTTPVTREKPYLYVDGEDKYQVFVPALQRDSAGTSWPDRRWRPLRILAVTPSYEPEGGGLERYAHAILARARPPMPCRVPIATW